MRPFYTLFAAQALKVCGVRATFFIVANFCRDAERLATLQRAVDEGHELGNHMCEDASCQHLTTDECGAGWPQAKTGGLRAHFSTLESRLGH